MGLYLSKLSIQALAVSYIAMHCSAAPAHDMTTADTGALTNEGSLSAIASTSPYNRETLETLT
ncbi:hypothetical protein DSO57_1022461 [Entomophthora muscae]|uniref:Uncharacterized protein n=1 Tax=Entomophthora muscae TaxID=34485 RepID=A0ACC2T3M0_9FUNG|nr:hypothetical protein DSO57_1022461 [Entomophthora muscae]